MPSAQLFVVPVRSPSVNKPSRILRAMLSTVPKEHSGSLPQRA